jgi:hypothetical protein
MVATRAQKRSAADNSNPLQQHCILQRILDFVGPGHWRFLAEVSRLWRDLYIQVSSREMQLVDFETISCVPQMTLFSAVFASPSRVRLAQAHQLDCTAKSYQRAAGMYADVATLEAAHELGMQYTEEVMLEAARCNALAVVQFLRAQGCSIDSDVYDLTAARGHIDMLEYLVAEDCDWEKSTCAAAARNGHYSTLRWLHERGCPWDAYSMKTAAAQGGSVDIMLYMQQEGMSFPVGVLTQMLNIAGVYNQLAAAKWLRQQGAGWPAMLFWGDEETETLQWARAEGCTSLIL